MYKCEDHSEEESTCQMQPLVPVVKLEENNLAIYVQFKGKDLYSFLGSENI